MENIKVLKAVHFYDDDDSLYAEFQLTFEYKGKSFLVDHIMAYSDAWNYRVIAYMPNDFERLYGGCMEVVSFEELLEKDPDPFTEEELINAAEILMESGEDEIRWNLQEDKEIIYRAGGKTIRSVPKMVEEFIRKLH